MTNISLPDAAGENLFKKELLEVMLVCPQWVYTHVHTKVGYFLFEGLISILGHCWSSHFPYVDEESDYPWSANLEIEWGLSMNCLYSLCCEKHTYSVSSKKQTKMGVSKQNAQVWLPQLCVVIHWFVLAWVSNILNPWCRAVCDQELI